MPTYDYLCAKCGHTFEEFQSITSVALRKCPQCGKLTLKRLIGSGAGIIFKGSGFYATDYRSDSYKSAAAKKTPAATDKKTEKKDTQKEVKPDSTAKKPTKPKSTEKS